VWLRDAALVASFFAHGSDAPKCTKINGGNPIFLFFFNFVKNGFLRFLKVKNNVYFWFSRRFAG